MSSGAGVFWTSRLLVVCACALLVYSFIALDHQDARNNKIVIDEAKEDVEESSPRLVFMVIDAFRLSFLTSPDSPMAFTKSSISEGSAHLFDAYARMPTVTLPRITSYITGTLPSFGTILTNLATDEIKIDNWISRLAGVGKRIHFFGDDTWIRLLPGKFEKFEGVTSFFVNDYTEVDRNVTRHLDSEFQNFPDVLILHYLGLDHIGHSLGGNSPKIPEKLKEMDAIIRKIHRFLRKSQGKESYLIVCGDHGMTPAGSHGGASLEETRVPVVMWRIGEKPTKTPVNPEGNLRKIEQIDVSSTIFDLFNLKIPTESYGISLAHYFRNETQFLEKQHVHFKKIVKEKKLSISDICEGEVCDYSNVFIKNALKKWFREVQEELIGTSSEVPNASIWICIVLLITATIISIRLWIFRSSKLNLAIFLVNFISFASSLIEEEHEIWYYLGSTVVVIHVISWIRSMKWHKKEELKSIIFLGVLHRLAFGFMQSTRRRWSMDPSLLPSSPFSDFLDIKDKPDLGTSLKGDPLMSLLSSGLWLLATTEHSNLILVLLPITSQVLRVFEFDDYNFLLLNIIRALSIPFIYFTGSALNGFLLAILAICPLSQVLLFLMIFQIGHLSEKLKFGEVENLIFCMASFFYTGNSNSLSTLSLTPAYVGLLDYYPIIVGFQLILYTFAGPIVFICGRNSATSRPTTSWLNLQFSYRISALATSLICLYIFQNHLFVWSVYSPKVVYDMAHVVFFSVIAFF